MFDKAVNTHPSTIRFFPDQYKIQEICDIPCTSLLIVYCPDKYKTHKMYQAAVDDCLAALKFIPDWFVTSKMYEKFNNALHANDDILYNEYFNKEQFLAIKNIFLL